MRGRLAALSLLALAAASAARAADQTLCPEAPAGVIGARAEEIGPICAGARDAFVFLAASGFTTDSFVSIVLTDSMQAFHGAMSFGSFDRRALEVRIGSMHACSDACEKNPPFGRRFDEISYRSLIAHEVAHAIASGNFTIARPTLAAQEYIAYVVQLGTMPEAAREDIVARSGLSGFDRADGIKDSYYLISPEGFAVNAWLHYLKPGNGAAFLRKVLDGALARSVFGG